MLGKVYPMGICANICHQSYIKMRTFNPPVLSVFCLPPGSAGCFWSSAVTPRKKKFNQVLYSVLREGNDVFIEIRRARWEFGKSHWTGRFSDSFFDSWSAYSTSQAVLNVKANTSMEAAQKKGRKIISFGTLRRLLTHTDIDLKLCLWEGKEVLGTIVQHLIIKIK